MSALERSTLVFDILSKHGNCRCTQPSAASAKVVRGTYLKISAEKKAKIGQRAAEHGVLAMVQYYAVKLPVTTGIHPTGGNSLIVGVAYLSSTFAKLFQ